MKVMDAIKELLGISGKSSKTKKSNSKARSTSSKGKKSGTSIKRKSASKRASKQPKKPTKTPSKTSKIVNTNNLKTPSKKKQEFPKKFPFWARFKPSKKRTTLVIDEEMVKDKRNGKMVEGFVHREATHTKRKDYEGIYPNPDSDDPEPMYLKRPTKRPKREFEPHNKNLDMPQDLQERYNKNNKKKS